MIRDSVIDWQELSALYEHADALDEAALATWLAQLRDRKHRLLFQLERMLDARARVVTGGFLDVLPRIDSGATRTFESEWAEGSRIGAYRLIRHVGSGGMAEVWLAERADGAFERQVAIKLLFNHPSRAQRESFVQRFKRERDILASLHHPNIAALHDAGVTPSGQPWLALEYVPGVPITAWCDAQRLTVVERVKVFRQVLLAVEQAHANLIIHRDLKPSNILVTDQGEVKLLDFGIAKLLAVGGDQLLDTALTRQGGRPLTLQYASPEQLDGSPLTTVSDVYSLGVVLYELLCGARPYDEERLRSAAQLEAAILAGEAMPPSRQASRADHSEARGTSAKALVRTLVGDLDALSGKALSGEMTRRYASVEALRNDVDRWLSHQPVHARKPTVAYRVSKFARRHAVSVSLSVVAGAALLGSASVAALKEYRAMQAATRAGAAKELVLDLLRMTDPQRSGVSGVDAKGMLSVGRDNALEKLRSQPDLLVDVLARIAAMQRYVGDYSGAQETLAQLHRAYGAVGKGRELAMVRIDMADNAYSMGDNSRASSYLADAEGRVKANQNDDALHAKFWLLRGLLLRSDGAFEDARVALEEGLRRATRAFGEADTQTLDVSLALVDLAAASHRYEAGRVIVGDALGRAARSTNAGPRDLVGIEISRMHLELEAGQFDVARQIGSAAIARCKAQLGEDTEDCLVLEDLSVDLLLRLGMSQEALSVAVRPVTLMQADRVTSPGRRAERLMRIARALSANGKLGERPNIRRELQAVAVAPSLSPDYRVRAWCVLSEIALREGEGRTAESTASHALALASEGQNPDQVWIGKAMALVGLAMSVQGRHRDAIQMLDRSDQVLVTALGREHPLTTLLRLNAVASLRHERMEQKASEICNDARTNLAAALGAAAPTLDRIRSLCATSMAKISRPEPPALLL